eukprot:10207211-Alexandrium_andersonii.AAC.1
MVSLGERPVRTQQRAVVVVTEQPPAPVHPLRRVHRRVRGARRSQHCRSQVNLALQDAVGRKAVGGRQRGRELAAFDAALLLHERSAWPIVLLRLTQLSPEFDGEGNGLTVSGPGVRLPEV